MSRQELVGGMKWGGIRNSKRSLHHITVITPSLIPKKQVGPSKTRPAKNKITEEAHLLLLCWDYPSLLQEAPVSIFQSSPGKQSKSEVQVKEVYWSGVPGPMHFFVGRIECCSLMLYGTSSLLLDAGPCWAPFSDACYLALLTLSLRAQAVFSIPVNCCYRELLNKLGKAQSMVLEI